MLCTMCLHGVHAMSGLYAMHCALLQSLLPKRLCLPRVMGVAFGYGVKMEQIQHQAQPCEVALMKCVCDGIECEKVE